MTAAVLLIWAASGTPDAIAEPWSAWFVALLIAVLVDS